MVKADAGAGAGADQKQEVFPLVTVTPGHHITAAARRRSGRNELCLPVNIEEFDATITADRDLP